MGYVLQRGQLCFHSMFADAWVGRTSLFRGWILAVAVSSVGLSVLYLVPWSKGLNAGLPFAPVRDIVGGVIIGFGMVVASSCVSGLFYKLGSGMLGISVGILGWIGGEAAARHVHLPGPTVLGGGPSATFAGVLGIPRLALSSLLLVVVILVLWRWRDTAVANTTPAWRWSWPTLGVALGAATIIGWLLARVGRSSFGPSTVGATASVLKGHPNWWLISFIAGLVVGAFVAAKTAGGFVLRGETPFRYVGLAGGGFLLGGGGLIAGGCNLGHGLSGVAQLNVSSFVVVIAMATAVGATWSVIRGVKGRQSSNTTTVPSSHT